MVGFSGRDIRKIVIDQCYRAGVGHVGPSLGVSDIIAVLYSEILNIPEPEAAERDRFVLSKGHAAIALYAALHLRGWLSKEELNTFHGDGTLLGVHPEKALRGSEFSTGSLGQGLTMAVGSALAARLDQSERRVFALISDGECNEGSIWESAMFAAHEGLENLVVIIDDNGLQALGPTENVLRGSPLESRWAAFGWDVETVDGHDPSALHAALSSPQRQAPRCVVAKTVSGKGVSFMENDYRWHYLPMDDDQYATACSEWAAEI